MFAALRRNRMIIAVLPRYVSPSPMSQSSSALMVKFVFARARYGVALHPRSHLSSLSFAAAAIVVQNPGRVVTLIHQEDWASFSGAVSFIFSVLSFTHKPNSK